MAEPRKPQLLDMVAVLDGVDDESVGIGDVGTVVELLPPNGVEVEFLDRDGRTRNVSTFPVDKLLVLNRDRTPVG